MPCSIDLLCNVSDLRRSTRLKVSLFKRKFGNPRNSFFFLNLSFEMNFRKSHNPGLLEFTADEVECLECGSCLDL